MTRGGTFDATNLPAAVASAVYDADNRLTNWGSQTLNYDADGNLTGDGTNTYTWNTRNQLMSLSGGSTGSFVYDALGRRESKTINGTSINFLYDGLNLEQELSGTTPTVNYLTGAGIDEVFSRTDSTGSYAYLTDNLGSTLALTSSAGAIQTSYTYEPYGNTTATGSASTNSLQYTGRENDGNGLYYNRARYYSPAYGRFISEDPIGLAGGINAYAYVLNNPLLFTDRNGLDVTITALAGIGGNPFGHVGISVTAGPPPAGFTPASDSVSTDFEAFIGAGVPGILEPVGSGRTVTDQITIHTTLQQDQRVLLYLREHPNGTYKFWGNGGYNCAIYAEDALRSAGLEAPSDISPTGLLDDLHVLYDPPSQQDLIITGFPEFITPQF